MIKSPQILSEAYLKLAKWSFEFKEQLDKSFTAVTKGLYQNSGINLRFSGSTCVSILIVGNKVFCANVGDSRATLARKKEVPSGSG